MAGFLLPDPAGNLWAVSTAVIFNFSFGLLRINPDVSFLWNSFCFAQKVSSFLATNSDLLYSNNTCLGHTGREMSVDRLHVLSSRQLYLWIWRSERCQGWPRRFEKDPSSVGI